MSVKSVLLCGFGAFGAQLLPLSFNDLHELDLQKREWTEVRVQGGPPPSLGAPPDQSAVTPLGHRRGADASP